MRWFSRIMMSVVFIASISSTSEAQSDICFSGTIGTYSQQERVEAMKIEAAERAAREAEHRSWEVRMFPVKNLVETNSLRALCIFRIEVVPQPGLRLVQVRAPKELMSTIEDAVKRLDVPQPVRKGVELTGYVLVVSDVAEAGFMPIPMELQSVENQLKNLLPKGTLYLADTILVRGTDGQSVGINKGISTSDIVSLEARLSIREGASPVVRLDNLVVQARNVKFETNLDVPVGAQVVVGKGTSLPHQRATVILVMTAKLFD